MKARSFDRRFIVLSAPLLAMGVTSPARADSNTVSTFFECRAYFDDAISAVAELVIGVRDARSHDALSQTELDALAGLSGQIASVIGAQAGIIEYLRYFITELRAPNTRPDKLDADWSAISNNLESTSRRLSELMLTAYRTPALANAVPANLYYRFFTLSNARVGVMERLVSLPRPHAADADLLETIADRWTTLVMRTQELWQELTALH